MKIRLHEIPEEGRQFDWSHETGEANHVLADLIGDGDYKASFFIRPINGRDFEMRGAIETKVKEICSRCGENFGFPVHAKFYEILIPYQPEDRTSKYSKVNHLSESEGSGPSVVQYSPDQTFEMGEYLHEAVALEVPLNPAHSAEDGPEGAECVRQWQNQKFVYDEVMTEEKPESPFAALKNLKI